jgi:hypothetical protein
MSRGIGNLQREILDSLDDAKRYFADPANAVEKQFLGCSFTSYPKYKGGAPFFPDRSSHLVEPGWVTHGRGFRIRDDIYDLRASCRYVAMRHDAIEPGGANGGVNAAFQASFSRAARSLVRRGLLYPAGSIVPIVAIDTTRPPQVLHPADGDYVSVSLQQCRFVADGRCLSRSSRPLPGDG